MVLLMSCVKTLKLLRLHREAWIRQISWLFFVDLIWLKPEDVRPTMGALS